MFVNIFLFKLIVINNLLVSKINAATKIWRFDNDVSKKYNWVNEKPSKECRGLIFPEDLLQLATIRAIEVSEIVLPISGEIILQDDVTLNPQNSTCIEVDSFAPRHWYDPDNWDYGGNRAVPDLNKLPCDHDDVIFPKGSTFNVIYPLHKTYVKSLSINGKNMTNSDLYRFLDSELGVQVRISAPIYDQTIVEIRGQDCDAPNRCPCHLMYTDLDKEIICSIVLQKKNKRAVHCLDPIYPKEHCGGFCGGLVTLASNWETNFNEFSKSLPTYEDVDLYVYPTFDSGKIFLQVLFADKERYTGTSKDRAREFYNSVKKGLKKFGITGATLATAGVPYYEDSGITSAVSIIFGTFFATIAVFAAIYYMYVGPGKNMAFHPSWNLFGTPARPFYFARFDNKGEGGVRIAEEESEGVATTVGRQRAFDNPLYGTPTPKVTKRSDSVKTKLTETSAENPLYTEMEELARENQTSESEVEE